MLPTDKQEIFFRSRVCRLSRPFVDNGVIRYEHNERLATGERVKTGKGDEEVTIARGGGIDLFSRRETVEVFVTRGGGIVERIQVPEDSLYRCPLAPPRT